jgi:TRAP-type uncharacterized transport system fused permease subunit
MAAKPTREISVKDLEFAGLQRTLGGSLRQLFFWLGAAYTAFHLLVLNLWPIDAVLFRAIHPQRRHPRFAYFAVARPEPWARAVVRLAVHLAANSCAVYIFAYLEELQFRADALYTEGDLIVGVVGTFLVLEFTRRTAA